MAGPPPHGTPLGLWKVDDKLGDVVFFLKENTNHRVVVKMTKEEAEYFIVGQSYSFTATQP